jgi:putative transposase
MPRAARLFPEVGFLHVISRGNNQRKLFFKPCDYRIYYRLLLKLKIEESVRILHYCFMPNHVHFLVGITNESDLSNFMKRTNLKYFYHYRKKFTYVGHLWQGRFKSKLIDDDEYFIQCGKYIELNPVRANMVNMPEDYPYSSYRYYSMGFRDKLVDEDPFYSGLGNNCLSRQRVYSEMITGQTVSDKLLDLTNALL